MKGETRLINGDRWTIVDLAPAAPLAEMVASILEEEGFVVMTRGIDTVDDAFSHLGAVSAGATAVLVPEADADRALELIAETVTDYQGEDLDAVLSELGDGFGPADLEALGIDLGETDEAREDKGVDEGEDDRA
jgi:outer membrane scaffolding protein for murein synthesis (MipA/OmpV family)